VKTAQLEEGNARLQEVTRDLESVNEVLQDKDASLAEMEELRRTDVVELEEVRIVNSALQREVDEAMAARENALQELQIKSENFEKKCAEVQEYIELNEDIFKDSLKITEENTSLKKRYEESSEKLQHRTDELDRVRIELKTTEKKLQVGKKYLLSIIIHLRIVLINPLSANLFGHKTRT